MVHKVDADEQMMNQHNEPPQWMLDYLGDCRELFGIGDEWRIWLFVHDMPNGSAEVDGTCDCNQRYLKATITVRRELIDNPERARYVIMHEALHVALGRLSQVFHRLTDMVPEPQREHALELMTDAEEQTIETLTRAMQRTIKPPFGKAEHEEPTNETDTHTDRTEPSTDADAGVPPATSQG